MRKHPTSNIEQPTFNVNAEHRAYSVETMLRGRLGFEGERKGLSFVRRRSATVFVFLALPGTLSPANFHYRSAVF